MASAQKACLSGNLEGDPVDRTEYPPGRKRFLLPKEVESLLDEAERLTGRCAQDVLQVALEQFVEQQRFILWVGSESEKMQALP